MRHSLPDADRFLCADTRTVRWSREATFQLDVVEFERALEVAGTAKHAGDQRAALERADSLYRADLLPNCYDEWIVPERERLRQCHRQALVCLLDVLESQRAYAEAIRYAQRLLRDDQLDEEACCCLMRLLALHNDRAAGLPQLSHCLGV